MHILSKIDLRDRSLKPFPKEDLYLRLMTSLMLPPLFAFLSITLLNIKFEPENYNIFIFLGLTCLLFPLYDLLFSPTICDRIYRMRCKKEFKEWNYNKKINYFLEDGFLTFYVDSLHGYLDIKEYITENPPTGTIAFGAALNFMDKK